MSYGSEMLDRAYKLAKGIREDMDAGLYVDLGGRIANFTAKEIQLYVEETYGLFKLDENKFKKS